MQVEYTVLPGDCRVTVRIDDRKLRNKTCDRDVGAPQVVGAHSDDFGAARPDGRIAICQIDELAAAERSPVRPIEDQHDVFIAPDLR